MLRQGIASILSLIGIVFILAGTFDMMVWNTALFLAIVFLWRPGLPERSFLALGSIRGI